jgi:hypothetical protein
MKMPWEEPIFNVDGNISTIKCKVHTKIHTSKNCWSQNYILLINMLGKGRMKKDQGDGFEMCSCQK